MEIVVERKWKKDTYTVGNLYVDGQFICNTLEDKDRGLSQTTPLPSIVSIKVPNETAIPTGTYIIDMKTPSPKFSQKEWYYTNCNKGKLPRLLDVPGFDGVLIHCGTTAKDSAGCILVGKNDVKGGLSKSREYFKKLYDMLSKASDKCEKIVIKMV